MPVLLSLFDHSGNWSRPFEEGGWNVIRIDKENWIYKIGYGYLTADIGKLNTDWFYENIFDEYGTVDGILAAPPCTDYAVSGAKFWKEKDRQKFDLFGEVPSRLETFNHLVYQVMRIVDLCRPYFYVIENPVGRIGSQVPEVGKPVFFQPNDYGDPYTKKTGLYGKFVMPEPTNRVEATEGSKMHAKYGGKSKKTKALRSITPMGFAHAFYEANKEVPENWYDDEADEHWASVFGE